MSNEKKIKDEISSRLTQSSQLLDAIGRKCTDDIWEFVRLLIYTYQCNGKVIIFGNGGSAADAQHIAAELVGRFMIERQALNAIALTTNSSIITALGNDYGFEELFSRQVEAIVKKDDVVVGLSTSGESLNVIKALKTAKARGAKTVVMTGENSTGIKETADLVLAVPSSSTPRIQEAHIVIGHIVCEMVENTLSK